MKTEHWPLSDLQISDLMKTLRFDYFKWDINACGKQLVLPESIILNRKEHSDAVQISERFGQILQKLELALCLDTKLLRHLGIPSEVIPLMGIDQPLDLQLARYDLFLTPDSRWMVSEFNEDVPGGFNEADGIPDLLGPSLKNEEFIGNLKNSVLEAFKPYPHVVFMFATGYSEDLQHMLIIKKWLEADGHSTELASPSHLRMGWRGPKIFGRRCDAAFRFYPAEWFSWLNNRRDWERALPALPMMNPVRRLIRQSKRLYTLWRDPNLLDREDIAFIEKHTPRTLPFEEASAFLKDRSSWVLKNAFGRMGDTVIMGSMVTDREWALAIEEAQKAPHQWLLQECFEVEPLLSQGQFLYPSLGVYLVNHKFAGYYSRAAHKPYINHEAYHVATLVENP